ncbi:MAG: HAD family hydrolase [Dehalococcoidia bacterium]|jgi:putative hydrolase of the HAD superfamily
MIKAVLFDFYNTLASYYPPREDIYISSCRELGIDVEAKALFTSLTAADIFYRNENSRSPIDSKNPEEKINFYVEYVTRIIGGAGAEISRDAALQILAKIREYKWEFKVYDDALPVLKTLKKRGLILGLISNVAQDMEATYTKLGLQPYLTFKVTSAEVGYDKPRPEIFLAALGKAKVKPGEALYVGDQYQIDVVGARGVGIKALLIDRNDYFPDITDCPRLHRLTEIKEYI